MQVLKVSKETKVSKLAGAIAGIAKNNETVELHAVGAASINQAVKSIAVARGYLAPIGVDLSCKPAFMEFDVNNEKRTGIKFICETK